VCGREEGKGKQPLHNNMNINIKSFAPFGCQFLKWIFASSLGKKFVLVEFRAIFEV
jgi:hypothetical protein